MKLRILLFACTILTTAHAEDTQKVNTYGNKVGIAADDVCSYNPQTNTITCASGKEFKAFTSKLAALTGTPGYLIYGDKKFIGTVQISPSMGMPGSGTRLDFICNDTCDQ